VALMRLGIDFGTTRTVVAAVDRGNYPVVEFSGPDGETRDWFPPLLAAGGNRRLYGWDAWQAQQDEAYTVVRSIKRFLQDAGPNTQVEIGRQRLPLLTLLVEMMDALRRALLEASSLSPSPGEPLEVMLGVPANANSNQRFLTTEAFRLAGFQVMGLLNEPSAASIEYGHRQRGSGRSKFRDRMLVYDLGGGTFDVSLVEVGERSHAVVASEGIPTLGGDDFDHLLAELALDEAGFSDDVREGLSQSEWFRLHEECREKKESLHPNTRRLAIDLDRVRPDWPQVSVPVAAFYEHCAPMVEETLHAVEDLLESQGLRGPESLEMLYVTGGGSELPLVTRRLREQFGRRVQRSAYTRSATAIGLAIQADAEAGYVLRDRFMRHFGVWREGDGGRTMLFDPLFAKGTELPGPGEPPLSTERAYRPVHNIGHFRYLECSHLDAQGRPSGDLMLWDDILFPFDPRLANGAPVQPAAVEQHPVPCFGEAVERYSCDAAGVVTVSIANRTHRYERRYRLGRWSVKDAPLVPGKRGRRPSRKS
jgi:molecular chaperone DnaK (HSP70)